MLAIQIAALIFLTVAVIASIVNLVLTRFSPLKGGEID